MSLLKFEKKICQIMSKDKTSGMYKKKNRKRKINVLICDDNNSYFYVYKKDKKKRSDIKCVL